MLNWSRYLNEQKCTGSLESGCAFLYVRIAQLEGDTDKDADKKTMPIVGDVYTTSGGLLEEGDGKRGKREFHDPLLRDE